MTIIKKTEIHQWVSRVFIETILKGHQKEWNQIETVFKILVLTSEVCFSEPNSSKNARVRWVIFLNSTLISQILLRKFDQIKAALRECKK